MDKKKRKHSPFTAKRKREHYGQIADKFIKAYYYDRYQDLFGCPPLMDYGKDKAMLKRLVKNYYDVSSKLGYKSVLELLECKCEVFFRADTQWARSNAFSIRAFYCEMPSLMLKNSIYNINIKDTIKGYKRALVDFDEQVQYKHKEKDNKYFAKVTEYLNDKITKYKKHNVTLLLFSELYFTALFEKYRKMKTKSLPKPFQLCTHFATDTFEEWLEEEGGEIIPFMYCLVGSKEGKTEEFNEIRDWTKELR